MTAGTWTARAKLPSFYVLQFEVYEGGPRMPRDRARIAATRTSGDGFNPALRARETVGVGVEGFHPDIAAVLAKMRCTLLMINIMLPETRASPAIMHYIFLYQGLHRLHRVERPPHLSPPLVSNGREQIESLQRLPQSSHHLSARWMKVLCY